MASGPARLLYSVSLYRVPPWQTPLARARMVVMMIQFLGSRGLACAVNSFRGRANVVATKEFLHTEGPVTSWAWKWDRCAGSGSVAG